MLVSSVTSLKEGRLGISKSLGPSIARHYSRFNFVSHLSFLSQLFVGLQLAEQWRNGCFQTTLTSSAGFQLGARVVKDREEGAPTSIQLENATKLTISFKLKIP